MNVRRLTISACAALLVLVGLISCQKEGEAGSTLSLRAERFAGDGSKMAVDGNTLSWVSGDQVRINGSTLTVSATESQASVSAEGLTAPFRAIYPASLASTAAMTADEVKLTFPATYQYHEAVVGGVKNNCLMPRWRPMPLRAMNCCSSISPVR